VLTIIVDALRPLGGFLGPAQGGQQHRGKDGNNGYDDQKLDQRERDDRSGITFEGSVARKESPHVGGHGPNLSQAFSTSSGD
jgi:hypothetical protein